MAQANPLIPHNIFVVLDALDEFVLAIRGRQPRQSSDNATSSVESLSAAESKAIANQERESESI